MGLIAVATADGTETERGASTAALDAAYLALAVETQRSDILTVGFGDGSGPVRGVHVYQGEIYAFRDNALGTECLMWKATTAGYVQQPLGLVLGFSSGGGAYTPVDGDVITGAISGAVATISRVVTRSGIMASGTASGYFVFASQTGTFVGENLDIGANSNVATIPVDSQAIVLSPGGHYEFENYNFYGATQTKRMYGVSGANHAFEWDGSTYVPIITGNLVDKPTHLAINEYHLMLTFANGSLQNSGTGNPYDWGGIVGGGANEIGCGDDLVGLKKEVGGALAVLCRNRCFQLQGKNTTASPWDLQSVSDESGGIEWTMQRIGKTRFLDDRGFTELSAVDTYGDFNSATYSQLIEPLIQDKKSLAISSIINKSKNQLRTFFSDGSGIFATFNDNKLAGFTTVNYLNSDSVGVPVRCTANGEDVNGEEILFFGSDDGYVYQMDKGPSFDGGEVSATFILTYNNLKSPSYDKEFKKLTIEADGAIGTNIQYNVLLDYSSGRSPSGITLQETLSSGGSYWNNVNWNNFNWASEDITQIEGNIDGVGRNISLQLSSTSTYVEPHILYGLTYHYIKRKLVR